MRLADRLRTRIPSLQHFYARMKADPRNVSYDLLPVLGGRGRKTVSSVIAALSPRTPGFAPSAQAQRLCAWLDNDGVTDVQPPIEPALLSDLRTYFEAQPCHDPYRAHLGTFRWDAPPSQDINIGYYTTQQVAHAPHLWSLLNAPEVLETMEARLGCKPVIDNIGAVWSYPGRAQAKSVQRFHRDYDCVHNVKIFFYLTDVDDDAGPHMFVRGSHRSADLETGRAQSDADIETTFGTDSIVRINGPAGSWFLEDVYGFHKGLLPVSKPRLMVAAQYNLYPSPHAPRRPFLPADTRFDPYINRLFLEPGA